MKIVNYLGYVKELLKMSRNWHAFSSKNMQSKEAKFILGNRLLLSKFADVYEALNNPSLGRGNFTGPIQVRDLNYFDSCPNTGMLDGEQQQKSRALIGQILEKFSDLKKLENALKIEIAEALKTGSVNSTKFGQNIVYRTMHRLLLDISITEEEVNCHIIFKTKITKIAAILPKGFYPIISRLPFYKRYLKNKQTLKSKYVENERFCKKARFAGLTPDYAFREVFNFFTIAVTGLEFLVPSIIGIMNNEPDLRNNLTKDLKTQNAEEVCQNQLLQKVIMEIARLYPPVDYMPRVVKQDTTLLCKSKKIFIPKGQGVLLGIYTANHDHERYENPSEFNLNRDYSDILSWGGSGSARECPARKFSINFLSICTCILLVEYNLKFSTKQISWEMKKYTGLKPKDFCIELK